MNQRKGLLSIGEMSRLTGASLRSLRYYEKIGILSPDYISPDSGYRYYTLDQSYLVEMIRFCIELDMPLKEFEKFVDAEGMVDYRSFLSQGRKIALEKSRAIKEGLKLIDSLEEQMNLANRYPMGQIYSRFIPRKRLYVKQMRGNLADIDLLHLYDRFSDMPYSAEDIYDKIEYGFMCRSDTKGLSYYGFIEVPVKKVKTDIVICPAGEYLCIQSETSLLEKVSDIFADYLSDGDAFIAVQIEIFAARHKISEPLYELRVLKLDSETTNQKV